MPFQSIARADWERMKSAARARHAWTLLSRRREREKFRFFMCRMLQQTSDE
jgi:hypothetical protein